MTQVRITDISGSTDYPISVYIADVYGNNESLIGIISSAVPPVVSYNSVIPAIFNTAPEIMLILVDSNGCKVFKLLDCTFGCAFEITVSLVDCIVNISIEESICAISQIAVES